MEGLDVDIVIESTRVFTDGAHVRSQLEAGAKNVIITAPAKNTDFIVVNGMVSLLWTPSRKK